MTTLELTIIIIVGVSIFLLAACITYVMRSLHKVRDGLSQAFDAINSLLTDDITKTMKQNESSMGRLHQYKGYVIKIISDGGGFKGIIYNNSMKETLVTTELFSTQDAILAIAKVHIDFFPTPPIPPRGEIRTEGQKPKEDD